jgi:uncharacterized protein YhbP (UPF0306 family)
VLRFKQFLLETKKEKIEPKPITLYHGATDYISPDEQIDPSRGEFYTTPDPKIATGYAFNEFSKDSASTGRSATDPTVLKFETDKNKFITLNRGSEAEGDQASRRAAVTKEKIAREIAQTRGTDAQNVQAQVWRLLNAGKGTQGQREFAGEVGRIPRQDAFQYVIPPKSKINILRTGTTDKIEDDKLEFIPQRTPQTSVAPTIQRPNIGVSAFQGIQLTGPRLTKIAKDIEDRESYFDLAPLDGDSDGIHASLDPDDPLYKRTK